MATAAAATAGPSALCSVNDDQKRWMVFGIALNKVLVEQIRPFVEKEVNKEYGKLKISHGIHAQSTAGRLTHWPSFLKYENINSNDTLPKVHGKYNNYSVFDCRVTSHLDFAKLYVENFMAKFNAFDEHCDASAVLALLSKVPVFSVAVQSSAGDVRQARNAWAHCAFSDWYPVKFTQSFDVMEHLVKALGLPAPDERTLLGELKDWETKGTLLCMNTPVDPALLQLVQHHVNALKTDVDKLTFDVEDERDAVKKALSEIGVHLEELENRVSTVEQDVKHIQDEQSDIKEKIDSLTSGQENLRERVTQVEGKRSFATPQISSEISSCEADVAFFAERHDADTRQWLFEDFNKWFRDPGNSRAYVLLGDAGVGKSVMAGALAQRTRKAGQLGAAYFCRHNDGTRNDPRYLLGTVACQLSECNREYSNLVGGEGGVRMMLTNSKLGVLELFTKLLQEPLANCTPCEQRKLVIIDALDETEYQSREDFLDLVMHRFPLLPKWLVFFITSRPEDTVQFRLKKYNPCIKICAGDSEHIDFYQQHERDIRKYLEKKLDFSRLAFSLEDVTAKCNGLFLYAHYIVEVLNDPVHSGKISDLNDLFPGHIEEFFRENFKRVFDKVGGDLYRKLFGCVIAAPSPLPLSCISFLLERENLNLDKQEVIDAVSQFVVHRTSDQTFAFLHSLIPSWLTDKKKASRRLSIDRVEAGKYFKGIILGLLPVIVNDPSKRSPSVESDLVDYVLRNGVHVLCGYDEKASLDIVFSCLTSYQFILRRMQTSPIEIYSVIGDLNLSSRCQALGDTDREILQEMWTVLESNIHSLLHCPHLSVLLSVLRNASKALQCKLAIPDGVSATWLEWNRLSFPVYKIPRDMSCFALSPNKMLLAGGKDQSISLFDAFSLEKVLGPVTVLESIYSVNHLEFSPDGKFVFFGKLDRLLSVDRGCVQEFPQFSGAATYYRWGSFVSSGRYLVVGGRPYTMRHEWNCIADVLCMWATQEVNQIQGDEIVSLRELGICFDEFRNVLTVFGLPVVTGIQHRDWYATLKTSRGLAAASLFGGLCEDCLRFKCEHQQLTLAIVRQRVIDLYDEIFQHQVWNVQSGNNVLDEVFSSRVELNPFFVLCHLPLFVFQECETLFCDVSKSLSLCIIALMNTVSIMRTITRRFTLSTCIVESSESLTIKSFIPRNVTKEFYDRIGCLAERKSKCSPDKKWMAVRDKSEVWLFRGTNQEDKHIVVFERAHVYVIKKVKDFDFTRNSKVIVYVTHGELLRALSLETGSIFTSVSGLGPLRHYTPKQQVGYVFRSSHEEINILINDFPTGVLCTLSSLPFGAAPVGVAFTSETGIKSVFKNARVTSWTISDSEVSRDHDDQDDQDDQGHHFRKPVKRCAFSLGGELIAIHYLSEIRLLREFKSDVVVFRESKEEGDWNVSWLTFSAYGTFLLYCIQRINDYAEASVHVWDVQKETLVAFYPQRKLVDCGCLSSNNAKLVICGELSVEILEFDLSNRRFDLLARLGLGRPCIYSELEKFSCCTVSSDSELLACCIVDGIHLYPLCAPSQQSLRQLPHGHLGRIEFCQFLKGTRYLISYGVDGAVFLWDLSEWKAVAYARIVHGRESIVSLNVSPEEDKVVCLTSFNRLIIIKLHGLISGATPSAFLSVGVTGSQGLTRKTSRGQLQEQAMVVLQSVAVPNEKEIEEDVDVDQLLEEMDFVLSSEDSEDGDEGESDMVLTD